MSLRDRLEAKARRREVVRVLVSDPGPDLQAAMVAAAELLAAQGDPGRAGQVPALQVACDDAAAAAAAHYAEVEFVALCPADFEALVASHTGPDGIDSDGLLVALAASCARDEDLADEQWWATQLDPLVGVWTSGERDDLYHRLFTVLHYTVPGQAVPKG